MYERNAIVLERYMEKILELNKEFNLKKNNENYSQLIHEIENYQVVTDKESKVIGEFDDTAQKIENLQQEQQRLYKMNKKFEEDRAQLFSDLGEDAKVLDNKFKKIEYAIEKNNEQLKEIREEFIKQLSDFSQRQKDRNKCEKAKRIGEANHIEYIRRMHEEFEEIDVKDVINLKDFVSSEKEQVKQDALEIMIKNGRSERVAFDQDVLRRAISTRIDIAEKEAECYVLIYDRMKKLLAEIDSETIKSNKHRKVLRDTSVKLAFLKAEKEYIVGFLDYERMTSISGAKAHKKMMVEACNNFELDMMQIKDLYELILKEVAGKATKKAYKELYNKNYLRNIEDKEKNFEEEVNNVNIRVGTVINSNYWRIEGVRNIYNIFQQEVSEKFGKDLSDYRVEEPKEEKKDLLIHKAPEPVAKAPVYEPPKKEETYEPPKKVKSVSVAVPKYKEEIYEEEEEEEDDFMDKYKQMTYQYDKEQEEEESYRGYLYDEDDEEEYDYEYEEDDDEEEYEEDDEYEYEEDDDDEYEYEEDDEYEYEEDDDDDDEEYKNIYKYNYDDDKYRREKRRQDRITVSFDDQDSLDMIIAKSRKKSIKTNKKKGNKGLFDKLFKKPLL